jgi:protein farnesyltransferase/geranylgeranyltransferase type-1 subunit alpha
MTTTAPEDAPPKTKMATISDAELEEAYGEPTVPGPEDPQWSDVEPVEANANPEALASIMYPPEYARAIEYLRAVMLKEETSPRCLRLAHLVITINPAHYTVWLYRFRNIEALGVPLDCEFAWLNGVALQHLKNYQIWHHRQSLLDLAIKRFPPSSDADAHHAASDKFARSELAFLATMLAEDTKNYHVWSYRQLLVRRLDLWPSRQPLGDEELAATMAFVDADVRNNSAWTHRFYLVFSDPAVSTPGLTALVPDPKVPADIVEREKELAVEYIRKAPQNQSAWNYLRGVLTKGGRKFGEVAELVEKEFGNGTGDEGRPASSHAIELLAEHHEQTGNKEAAAKCWDQLAELDPVREKYWNYMKGGNLVK